MKIPVVMNLMHHESDWQQAHRELSRIAKSRARLDWEEGTWVLRARRAGVHDHLGFASFPEYIARLLGYGPRWTEERLRVAEALEQLPALAESLRDGIINWSTARELTRVADAKTEAEWLELAKNCTAREVEQMVVGHKTGDSPCDLTDPSLRRHVIRMELSGATLATFREAMAKLRRDAGESIDDDSALLLMSRVVLGGPADEGRSSYQVALTLCDACGRGWQKGRGESIEVGRDVIETAVCDAQHVPHVAAHVGAVEKSPDRSARAKTSLPRSGAK